MPPQQPPPVDRIKLLSSEDQCRSRTIMKILPIMKTLSQIKIKKKDQSRNFVGNRATLPKADSYFKTNQDKGKAIMQLCVKSS